MLEMWTVYRHPTDFPEDYVARCFMVEADGAKPTTICFVHKSLKAIRARLAGMGLTPLARSYGDEPQIVETWL